MRKFITCAAVGLICATTGCASIIKGQSQTVHVSTIPEGEAECTLRDSENHVYTVRTPGNAVVSRGDGPMTVSCNNGTLSGERVVGDEIEGWFVGNIVAGGIIGGAIDAGTGAYQKYPDDIVIHLK